MIKRAGPSESVPGPWELPDGWRWERLGDVAEINPRTDLSDLPPDRAVTFLPMAAVSEENGAVDVAVTRPASDVLKGFTRFRSQDVLFAKITPCMENGKVAVVPALPGGVGTGSTEFHVVRAHALDPRFVFYFLVQRAFRQEARRNMSGSAGQLRVPTEYLREHPIPVPPPDIQRRIVARIEALFDEIAEGEQALADAREGVETYRKALLKAAVTGELTAEWRKANLPSETGEDLLGRILAERRARWEANPKNRGKKYAEPAGPDANDLPKLPDGWCWATLRQLMATVRNGVSVKPAGPPDGLPILRISAVRAMRVDATDARRLDRCFDAAGYWVQPGDLLVTRYNGSPALVGVCGRFRSELPIVHPDKLIRLVPVSPDEGLNDYIEIAINVGASRLFIERNTKTTAGQHGVSGETVGDAPIPLPPRAEASAIAAAVTRSLRSTNELESMINAGNGSAELRQSILAAAFRGELVS